MAAYNPQKKIKIEIKKHENAALGYEIWDTRDKDRSRLIYRDADESDISEILTPDAYAQFENGTYFFIVRSHLLVKQFSYFY